MGVRASDHDRSRVAAELQLHCIDGRITVDELDRRVERAMDARTIHQLACVVADLPAITIPEPVPEPIGRVRVGTPGIRPFTRRIVVPASIDRTRAVVLETVAPGLNGSGYELRRQDAHGLQFERRRGWRRVRERVVIAFERHTAQQTVMIVHGVAPRRIRRAFTNLTFT